MKVEKGSDEYPNYSIKVTPNHDLAKTKYFCAIQMSTVIEISEKFDSNSALGLSGSLMLFAMCALIFTKLV